MTGMQFVAKWQKVQLTERSASQQHFLDLCELVEHPKPAEADPTGEWFTFERGAAKHGGGDGGTPRAESRGWSDVWKRAFFGWEYKGKHKDLDAAYDQLLLYREDLENPPLLVTCDMDRIVIHTNFTSTPATTHVIRLQDLASPDGLAKLRAVFHNPEALRPGVTCASITADAAGRLAELAQVLRDRGLDPGAVAHFLDRIVFCLFAEDIRLLPDGLFTEILRASTDRPERFSSYLSGLFQAMATGGDFLLRDIPHFNGNLFDSASVIDLTADELRQVTAVAALDWSAIDPSIFGTLFVRGMDPALRSQLGAEYTGREDIETLVEPVVMAPIRREWATVREAVDAMLPPGSGGMAPLRLRKAKLEGTLIVRRFLERLSSLKVLDPACGSGNFLYVVLQKLKDLEKGVILFAQDRLQASFLPTVGPWQLYGIEINPYAHDLAQMTVWIGYLQWTRANGFGVQQKPILRPLSGNFRCMDSILDLSDPEHPREPEWPKVDFLVGNPPFLGRSFQRRQLGEAYMGCLFRVYAGRLAQSADLCCYWFERARAHIEAGRCRRAGLLATQGIRGGANRRVLERIRETGSIFFAESDRPWVLDGASVHVSMVGFDDGTESRRVLDGQSVHTIGPNLSSAAEITRARILPLNTGIASRGSQKRGPFAVPFEVAVGMLTPHGNPGLRPNSDVLFPYPNGSDVAGRNKGTWVVDFGVDMEVAVAAGYEVPFAYLEQHVKPSRMVNRDARLRDRWWLHGITQPAMRSAVSRLPRVIVSPRVAKHRLYAWVASPVLPDDQLIVFARPDDTFLGLLHSRLHEVWALAQGTQVRERESGFRYTPTTCFETFPFPWAPGRERAGDPLVAAIGEAAAELVRLRDAWLNPPEWTREGVLEFPATVGGPWDRFIVNPRLAAGAPAEVREPDATALEFGLAEHAVALARREAAAKRPVGPGNVGLARYPRRVPRDPLCAQSLAKRTLTNLYNQRPTWLALAHRRLDEAVCAAYQAARGGEWSADMPEEKILEQLLALNLADAGAASS